MSGAVSASSSGTSQSAVAGAATPSSSSGTHSMSYEPVEHRDDGNDADVDGLKHVPADRVPQGLARLMTREHEQLRGFHGDSVGRPRAHRCEPRGQRRPWARNTASTVLPCEHMRLSRTFQLRNRMGRPLMIRDR